MKVREEAVPIIKDNTVTVSCTSLRTCLINFFCQSLKRVTGSPTVCLFFFSRHSSILPCYLILDVQYITTVFPNKHIHHKKYIAAVFPPLSLLNIDLSTVKEFKLS
jgi:hypothetical protein